MKPWLHLPAAFAHDLAPVALRVLAEFRQPQTYAWRSFDWRGMHFANPLGIAGGVDKDGDQIEAWWTFGPGFIEIGTVTPKPQLPNPGKILDRDIQSMALWNRMGFPGDGAHRIRENLRDLPERRHTPVFINIGKNRDTPLERAAEDYAECMSVLESFADAFVINISSPNTTGLRELLQPVNLRRFLGQVMAARNKTGANTIPILLKISPDLEDADLISLLETSTALGINGFIATNTTLARDHGSPFPNDGGVSGYPLASRSKQILRTIVSVLGDSRGDLLIISTGGVLTPKDVVERLKLGANLVQVYTALTYNGPFFFRNVARAIEALTSS